MPKSKKQSKQATLPAQGLKSIFDITTDAIFVHDKNTGDVLDVNLAATQIYGYSHAEFLSNKLVGKFSSGESPYTNDDAKKWIQKAIKEGPQSFDWHARRKDNSLFWVRVNLKFAILNGIERVLAVVHDIDAQKRVEQTFENQYALYQNLFENSPSGIIIEKADGTIIDINQAVLDIFGYKKQELIGKHVSIFSTEKTKGFVKGNIDKLLKGEKLRQIEESKRKDGTIIYNELLESRIKLPNGEYGILSISDDKTERVLAEQALIESEERFRNMFEQNRAIMMLVDPVNKQRILDVNQAATEFYGYSRNQFLKLNIGDISLVTDEQRAKIVKKALKRPDNFFIFKHILANGEIKDVEVYASPIVQSGQNLMYVIVHDVSERVLAEKELNRLAILVEQAADAIIITDVPGNIQYVNPAFEIMTGYSRVEALGQNPRILKSGQHENEFYKNLWETILSEKKWENTVINKRKNGETYHQKSVIFPINNQDGETINFAAILRDITQEKNLEHQVNQLQKMEAIGTLSGGIAHDFNNILTVINGHAEIALMRVDKQTKVHNDLVSILSAGKRAAKLTSQLLAFSRKQVHEAKVVDLNEIVMDMQKMLRRLIDEDIQMDIELSPDLPNIKADSGQIEQVIINLIVNARDAINEVRSNQNKKLILLQTSEVEIDTFFVNGHPGSRVGRHVRILVKDSGKGMDEVIKSKVFEPFFTTKDVDKGTGLGLSTVYGIVKQNEGSIFVESTLGEGSTFCVYWPVTTEIPKVEKKKELATKVLEGSETILFVEDNEGILEFAVETLGEMGYTVIEAINGREAQKILLDGKAKIDMLITDIIMPEISGKELAESIKDKIPPNRVLYVSGYPYNHLVQNGTIEEGIRFLQKPYSVRELLLQVRDILDHNSEI